MLRHADLLFFVSFCVHFLKYCLLFTKKMDLASREGKVGVLILLFIMLLSNRKTNCDRISFLRSLYSIYISFPAQLGIKIQAGLKPKLSADFEIRSITPFQSGPILHIMLTSPAKMLLLLAN